MSWEENINNVKEIFSGTYQIILDFATNAFVPIILNNNYKYVWVYQHRILVKENWSSFDLPLDHKKYHKVLARRITYDFIIPTSEFKEVYPNLGSGITLVQINKLPQYYLDPTRIEGKTRYELLSKECDYLFEIDIPSATDYGTLRSSNKVWLESLLIDKNIDWDRLP